MAEVKLDEESRNLQAGDEKPEAAVHLSPTDAASIDPWRSSFSRWEQHKCGSGFQLSREIAQQHQLLATPVHIPQESEGGDEHEEEQMRSGEA